MVERVVQFVILSGRVIGRTQARFLWRLKMHQAGHHLPQSLWLKLGTPFIMAGAVFLALVSYFFRQLWQDIGG